MESRNLLGFEPPTTTTDMDPCVSSGSLLSLALRRMQSEDRLYPPLFDQDGNDATEEALGHANMIQHSQYDVRVEWRNRLHQTKLTDDSWFALTNPPFSTSKQSAVLVADVRSKTEALALLARPIGRQSSLVLPLETDLFDARYKCRQSTPKYRRGNTVLLLPKAAATPPLLTEMKAIIQGWTDLSNTRRRDLLDALALAMHIDAVPDSRQLSNAAPSSPATMSCTYLNTRLFRHAHAIYGIKSPARFANILSLLRCILRRLREHEPPYPGVHTLQPAWRTLHDALSKHRKIALSGFMRFCSARSVTPQAVTTETLADFEAWLLARTLCRDAPVRARAVASNWTWARAEVPGWPNVPLIRPRMRKQYVRPFEAYPAALRADADRYLARLAFSDAVDIFPDDVAGTSGSLRGRRKKLKPRTIEGRSFQLRQCLAALVIMGRDPATITSLRQLVHPPEQARVIMKFYLDLAGNRRTSQTRNIGEVLRQVALFHCRLEKPDADRIASWARNAAPDVQLCITEKNMRRLQALREPQVTGKLLNLPEVLMKEAADPELRPREAALLAFYATALDILLACPLRRSNLAGLRLDQHLQQLDPQKKLVNYISLSQSETKTDKAMLWPLPERVAIPLDVYVKRYRPLLTQSGNRFLFPNTKMGPRSAHDMAVGLTKLVESRIGCEFNMHLIRHFVVDAYLRRHPGQYDVARKLLGHSDTSYTIQFYAPLEVDSAARSLDETMTLERTASPHHPTASRRQRPGRPPIAGGRV